MKKSKQTLTSQTVVGRERSGLTSTQTSQARPEAWMKTLSIMYARPNMG